MAYASKSRHESLILTMRKNRIIHGLGITLSHLSSHENKSELYIQ